MMATRKVQLGLSAVTWVGPGGRTNEHLTRNGEVTLCGRVIAKPGHKIVANANGNLHCRQCAAVALGWHADVHALRHDWPAELDVAR
jgi:regulator of RNase E activity RraA